MKQPSEKSKCPKCTFYDSEFPGVCTAFPTGIPDKFLETDAVHDKVQKGQVGDNVFLIDHEYKYPEL